MGSGLLCELPMHELNKVNIQYISCDMGSLQTIFASSNSDR